MTPSDGGTLIRGATVFDGTQLIGKRDVLVRDGIISEVAKAIPPDSHAMLDAENQTLLPGLIDAHVHTFGDALTDSLAFGVTTVIDMFTHEGLAAHFRREQAEGEADGRADIVSAGHVITAPGGHGTQFGVPIETLSSPEEAEALVAGRIDAGSEFIKIIWEVGDGTWPTLDEATIAAVVEATHQAGKIAAIHVTRHSHARRAVELGVDGLAHIFADPPDDDFGRIVADAGAFAVPTMSVVASACSIASAVDLIDERDFGCYLTPMQEASLRGPSARTSPDRYQHAQRAVAMMVEAGANVLAGTDARNPGTACGASLHRELELLAECGMTPLQALTAATSGPAAIFGLTDRGVIAEGKVADLILVDGDPSSDLSATRRIAAIFKRGKRFDRAAYRDQVNAARETEAQDV
jgi:imidazolonepropionase-like amidohydrolase